jgi:hypothetical protein
LKTLGIKAKKELPRNLIDSADGDTAAEPETEN